MQRPTCSMLRVLWGLEKEEKLLSKGIRKVFVGKRTLAINLGCGWCLAVWNLRQGERLSCVRSWRAKEELSPLDSSRAQPAPAGSRGE